MILYKSVSAMDLVSVDRRGTTRPVIEETRMFYFPRLSPDGRRILVGIGSPPTGTEVWVIDLASGGTLTKLAPDQYNIPAGWTPDGRRVIWSHGSDAPAVWWQPWDASAPAEKLIDNAFGARLFPDGKQFLTAIQRPGGERQIRIVPLPVDTMR